MNQSWCRKRKKVENVVVVNTRTATRSLVVPVQATIAVVAAFPQSIARTQLCLMFIDLVSKSSMIASFICSWCLLIFILKTKSLILTISFLICKPYIALSLTHLCSFFFILCVSSKMHFFDKEISLISQTSNNTLARSIGPVLKPFKRKQLNPDDS